MIFLKKTQRKKSIEQFVEDFGHFPPNGITSDLDEEKEFEIHLINKTYSSVMHFLRSFLLFFTTSFFSFLAEIIKDYRETILSLKNNHPSDFLKEIIKNAKQIKVHPRCMRIKYKNLRKNKNSIIQNRLLYLHFIFFFSIFTILHISFYLLAFLFPVLFILFFPLIVLVFLVKSGVKHYKATKGFVMKNDDKNCFIIYEKEKGNNLLSYSTIVSHEHIHVRQFNIEFIERGFDYNAFHSFFKTSKMSEICKNRIIYLLGNYELEVRLHEYICRYYNHFNLLPNNKKTFICMMISDKFFCIRFLHSSLKHILNDIKTDKAKNSDSAGSVENTNNTNFAKSLYDIVDSKLHLSNELDLELIFSYLNAEFVKLFVEEILLTTYANLLKLYGDEETANNIYQEIKPDNLYNKLYPKKYQNAASSNF